MFMYMCVQYIIAALYVWVAMWQPVIKRIYDDNDDDKYKIGLSHLKRIAIGNELQEHSRSLEFSIFAAIAVYEYHFLSVDVVTTSLSNTVSETFPLFHCIWLPVSLKSPAPFTIKFKSQAACNFQFMCKHSQLKHATLLELLVLTKV